MIASPWQLVRSAKILCVCASTLLALVGTAAELPRCVEPNAKTGTSKAVVIGDWPLVHTAQILPGERDTDVSATGASEQIAELLDRMDETLRQAESGLSRAIKLNFYVASDRMIEKVNEALAERFRGAHKPAVSLVATRLPREGALVAADAVASTSDDPGRMVKLFESSTGLSSAAAVIPHGTRLYISGQAERGESLAEATRTTLASLRRTLRFLGRQDADIVQLKAFLQPMSDAAVVEREVADFFGERPVPPLVLVEWQSSATSPIEIELIAWGGVHQSGAAVEYLTPPGMKASGVFSRVARVNQSRSIYLSSLQAAPGKADADPDHADVAKREVAAVFDRLQSTLRAAGSDMQHLVKATYYVSNDSASSMLNELRPDYYDPARPPAASKAKVTSVGDPRCGLSLDMIAVPSYAADRPEYGPAEYGHGLDASAAAAGWISLFDGRTTFGWKGATIIDGALSGGETTTPFGNCELRATFATSGAIEIGGTVREVSAGPFRLDQTAPDSKRVHRIRLAGDTRVERVIIRPLGLQSIFNGRDLLSWRPINHPRLSENRRTAWRIEDGALRATGGPGCVEYQGGYFGDMVFQIDVRTRVRHANGGIFFRAIPGDFMNGYEAQVYNRGEDSDPSRPATWSTGAIDDRMNARRVVSRDGQFFRMTIIASGAHIATWVNGFQQTDFHDDRPPHENPRQGRRTDVGVIQLQAHDHGTDVEFKNMAVLPLTVVERGLPD